MTLEDPAPVPPAVEPCPPPLAWQEVAQAFHETAETRIVATDEADLKVTAFGSGTPVIFFPPAAGSARLFCLTAWMLKDEYRCLIFERPRFHRSPAPQTLVSRTAEVFSLAVQHFLPAGADLYATSTFGPVALELMLTHPRLVRSAFLQGTWLTNRLTFAERTLLQLGRHMPGQLRQLPLWQSAVIRNHRHWFPPFDETRFGFLVQECGETSIADFATAWLALDQSDLAARLPQITAPVKVLHCEGEGSRIATAQEEIAQAIPLAQREEMPHAGLIPYLTHPQRLSKLLKAFWSSLPRERV